MCSACALRYCRVLELIPEFLREKQELAKMKLVNSEQIDYAKSAYGGEPLFKLGSYLEKCQLFGKLYGVRKVQS